MKHTFLITLVLALLSGPLTAQEEKPVPKDSMRVSIPGCTKGYIFTAGLRTPDEPGSVDVPAGTHLRMNGPKKMMAEIKAHEGSKIEIIGLVKKGQHGPAGVAVGGGVRIAPGSGRPGGTLSPNPVASQVMIDVEGWRPAVGECSTR